MRSFGSPLADYLIAAHALSGGDARTRGAIAALLGLELAPTEPPADARPSRMLTSPADPPAPPQVPPPGEPRPVVASHADAGAGNDDAWLHALPPAEVRMPAWLDSVDPFPKPGGAAPLAVAPALLPLFTPSWRVALLRGLLLSRDPVGEVNVPALLDALTHGWPLTRLPRRSRPRMGAEVQVMVDTGPSMAPFAEDQGALLNDLRRLVPLRQELVFETTPVRAGAPGEWPLPAYRPPAPGTPVLVMSDLGAARGEGTVRAPADEWLRFAATVRRTGCALVALVPFGAERVQPALRHAIAVVKWDRSTTTGAIEAVLARRGVRG